MQETDISQGTNNKDKWIQIDKLKQPNSSCFFLSYLNLHLAVALPARLLKAPLLRPAGSALKKVSMNVINIWRSIVILSFHSCSLFIPIHHFPHSKVGIWWKFMGSHLQELGLALCAVDLGSHVGTTRPEGLNRQLFFWILVKKSEHPFVTSSSYLQAWEFFQLSETNICFIFFWYNLKPCHAMNAACNTWTTPEVS